MSTESQEYTDEATGITLTVEYDKPEYPKLKVSSKGCIVLGEELDAAIRRLLHRAGRLPPEEQQGGRQ